MELPAAGDIEGQLFAPRSWTGWRSAVIFVHSDTVVRWRRTAWRRHWARKSHRRGPGRPRLDRDTQDLIRRMARENPRWGACGGPKPVRHENTIVHQPYLVGGV